MYDVITWLNNLIHIFDIPNISKSKEQAMKFGQLIEYNMRNIFSLKNHTQNVVEKLVSDPFLKNQNSAYL